MIKVQRILLRAGVITLFMLAYLVFGSQTRVLATTGGYVAGSAQYHVTVTYDVDNSCDYKDYNYFLLYGPVKSKSFENQ